MSERKLILEVNAVRALRNVLETITDDEIAIRDTIEGEADLNSAVKAVLSDIREDEILSDGIASMMAKLSKRCERLDYRIERQRTAIQKAMEIAEIHSMNFPDATLSIRQNSPGLEVSNEAEIPAMYFKPQPSKLDKTMLKTALKDGKIVPGATLDNGSTSLTIRRS